VSTAPAGSLQARGLDEEVRVARIALARATDAVAKAESQLATARGNQFQQEQGQSAVIDATTQSVLRQIDALRERARVAAAGAFRTQGVAGTFDPNADRAQKTLASFLGLMEKLSTSGTRADKIVGGALGRIAGTLGRLPTEKQVRIVITVATHGGTVADAVRQAGLLRSNEDIAAASADARSQSAQAIGQENVALEQEFLAAEKVLKTEQKKLAVRKAAAATAISEAQSARDAVQSATDSLTSANDALASSEQGLADAIKNGQDAVTNAVNSAKTNLRSIAGQIAAAISQASDQGALKIGPEGPLAKKFQALRDQILKGQGGPETQRAAQEVAARIQAQQPGDDTAARAKKRLDDLADSFDRGKIGAGQFNSGLQRILKESGLNLATFGKTFGSAALNDLRDTIAAAKQQARAIAAGPTRPGGGGAPNIVRPLQAVAQAERDVKDATKNVERATRDVARAQRDLQSKQLSEERAHTKELKAIRTAVQAQLRVTRQQNKLLAPKTKPTGKAAKDALDAANAGAAAP
jgi:hypothetical protein